MYVLVHLTYKDGWRVVVVYLQGILAMTNGICWHTDLVQTQSLGC